MEVYLVYVTATDFVGMLPVAAFRTREAANAFMIDPDRQQGVRLLDARMGVRVLLLQDVCPCGRTKDDGGFCAVCDELNL
jgi:hypothetical protein